MLLVMVMMAIEVNSFLSKVHHIAAGILAAMGYEVLDLGLVTTPTVQLMVKDFAADGGLIITSSHNPIEWNGTARLPPLFVLQFSLPDRLFLSFPLMFLLCPDLIQG